MARRFGYGVVVPVVGLLLTGCAVLPASGPLATDIVSQESPQGVIGGYVLVDVDERVASISASQPRESFKSVFSAGRPAPDLRIGVSEFRRRHHMGGRIGRAVLRRTDAARHGRRCPNRDHPGAGRCA